MHVHRRSILLAFVCLGAAGPPGPPAPWPLRHYVRWEPTWGSRTIDAAGLRARVELRRCGVDRPASEACYPQSPYPVVTVSAKGLQALTVQGDPGVATYVGIGRLTRDASRASLIVLSEHGGSGGCVDITAVVATGRSLRGIRLGLHPDDGGTLCGIDMADLAWPRDVTGHGRPEFLMRVPAASSRFTSNAGRWRSPRVVAIAAGRTIDVSADPALAPLYRKDMARARYACEHRVTEAEGPCSAYAHDAARVGRLPQALRVIAAQVRRGCRVPVRGSCPDIDFVHPAFLTEIASMR